MQEIEVSAGVKTGLPPCCLQLFRDNWVFVGTYELEKVSGYRHGSVDMYTLDGGLQLVHSEKTYGAVLDLQLSPWDDTLVATAHSTGNVMLWRVDLDDMVPCLSVVSNMQVYTTETLITSIRFSPVNQHVIAVTNTLGECSTVNIESLPTSLQEYNIQGHVEKAVAIEPTPFTIHHSLECWIVEFGRLAPLQNVIFSGGDDATIVAHDLRSQDSIWTNSRIHDAGVVAIKCSHEKFRSSRPYSILTGSYDDHLRALDLRMLGSSSIYPGKNVSPTQIHSTSLGGGVWRLVESPTTPNTVLACCMYNGAKIINIDDRDATTFREAAFVQKGHDSMCYGGDWSRNTIVTCSFYDKSLQQWSL